MNQNNNKTPAPRRNPLISFLIMSVIATILLNVAVSMFSSSTKKEISYSEFLEMVRTDKVDEVIIQSEQYTIYEKPEETEEIKQIEERNNLIGKVTGINMAPVIEQQKNDSRKVYYAGYIPDSRLYPILDEHGVKYSTPIHYNNPLVSIFISTLLPMLLMVGLFMLITRSLGKKMGGGGIMGIGQSNAKMYNVEKATGVTFADVAGQEEAKESLNEIVDFLHHPQKYTAIGAKLIRL